MTDTDLTRPGSAAPDGSEPVNAQFTRSDTVAGYVTGSVPGGFGMRTGDGRRFEVEVNGSTSAEMLRNLGQPYLDASGHLGDLLVPGRFLYVHGVFYPSGDRTRFEAKRLVFVGRGPAEYAFENPLWWVHQIDQLASFYRRAQFGSGPVDFRDYRTVLRLSGDKSDSHVQETDTISRLVYGMASAYMLTGNEDYLDVAERGTEYLRSHMRFVDRDEDTVFWYHGIEVQGDSEKKLFTSEFGDDYDAIPMYEQIYALAGPVQTYRVTGDPRITADTDATLRLFERFFRDHDKGGYYSHVDPIFLDPHHESLGVNASRKNWNSVGDHAPAYLVNLFLATGEERHAEMLKRTFDTITEHFPDYGHSPFVQERFHDDWSPDRAHGWQQDRAVVGHNLKIAWNLTRMDLQRPDPAYTRLARHIADLMPGVGADPQRGGWYDVVERVAEPGLPTHRFTWHDRKAWWQQEQAILAYLVIAGQSGDPEYLRQAREAAAFYNAFFLDHDEGGVYFNVLAEGLPYLVGTERFKGSHSMSMYHSAELCFLAAVYGNLLIHGKPMTLWFRPRPDAPRLLRVQPDMLPAGAVRLTGVEIDGAAHDDFDPDAMTVALPESAESLTVRVRLTPVPADHDRRT
ncbi:AGE family epimerase/isomerase [Actinorugispora endophytica]|uniref:Mannose/cellobiose epimerase-like protein (N-acyl-D-glucosamine 2-epimerase family) n=1 Tax=Actinorugispora endophytica TaxID=1605990 RepID=A0A4R6UMU3_9ACTN|nr:AGE family epimerase/isomerase [Actinorugispora endophytica]TDQ46899.1 mannose/cellobiose epimerase-like protein (N-acyl-D-glucosamine 2-epimerase family) [Actinorugispora endophytica]